MLRRILQKRRLAIKRNNPTKQETDPTRPFFMRPVVFLSGWVALGILFGFQETVEMSLDAWKVPFWIPFAAWTLEFLLWGLTFLGMWHFLRASIQAASTRQMLVLYLPLSVLVGIVEEVLYITIFRYQHPGKHYGFLTRLV